MPIDFNNMKPLESKYCSKCRKDTLIKDFTMRKNKDGEKYPGSICRTCVNKHAKDWRDKKKKEGVVMRRSEEEIEAFRKRRRIYMKEYRKRKKQGEYGKDIKDFREYRKTYMKEYKDRKDKEMDTKNHLNK